MTTWLKSKHEGLLGRRQLDLPQELPRCAPCHAAGFQYVSWYSANAECGAARHRRHGEPHGRQHGWNLAEAEEHDHRPEIGHVRRCLHHVKDSIQDTFCPGASRGPYAEGQAERCRDRYRHHDDGQRLHGVGPQAEDREIERAGAAEDSQARTARPMREDCCSGQDRDPRKRGPAESRQAAEE